MAVKLKLKNATKEQREYQEFIERTATIVRSWPKWMRGDYTDIKPKR